ncbi:hypothetical protein J2X43_004061 [Rhizobium sp. BE258]|nr:hypothetical protein [Rhizobium sp. BE258]
MDSSGQAIGTLPCKANARVAANIKFTRVTARPKLNVEK